MITTSGHTRTIYVGGQNAVAPSGAIAGKGDIGVQAKQVARNQVALAAANAGIEHLLKWTIYVVQGQPLGPAMGAFQQVLGPPPKPPTISVLFAAALAHPDFLLEVEATGIVPDE